MDDRGPNPQITLIVNGEPRIPGYESYYHAKQQRQAAYDIGHELNLLFDDIESGVFGEAAKQGRFYQYVQSIKQQIPKPPGPQ